MHEFGALRCRNSLFDDCGADMEPRSLVDIALRHGVPGSLPWNARVAFMRKDNHPSSFPSHGCNESHRKKKRRRGHDAVDIVSCMEKEAAAVCSGMTKHARAQQFRPTVPLFSSGISRSHGITHTEWFINKCEMRYRHIAMQMWAHGPAITWEEQRIEA
jgi:hypothetical protein